MHNVRRNGKVFAPRPQSTPGRLGSFRELVEGTFSLAPNPWADPGAGLGMVR
jgi:hypothetical protein